MYENFLKSRTTKSEAEYKTYKTMLEVTKRKSKKYYYSQKIIQYKNNATKTGNIIKEVIGKTNKSGSCLPTEIAIEKNDMRSESAAANEFNTFFTNIGPKLSKKIPIASRTFESFLNEKEKIMLADSVTIKELKEAHFPYK